MLHFYKTNIKDTYYIVEELDNIINKFFMTDEDIWNEYKIDINNVELE